jgi:hypothetical protein
MFNVLRGEVVFRFVDIDGIVDHNTSCLPMVSGSLWVLRLLPPLKLVAMI